MPFDQFKRRDLIWLFGASAVAWPLAARAQPAMPVIGVLNSSAPPALADLQPVFRQGLADAGFVVGKNVELEYRWAEGRYDYIPALAADLVQRRVAVIVAIGDSAWAAKAATTTIPIVFANGSDPVASGLVPNLSRPGGNVTGVSWTSNPLVPKQLEFLRDLIPRIDAIGFLVNPNNPSAEIDIHAVQSAARTLQLRLEVHRASTKDDISAAFVTMSQQRLSAVVIGADSFFVARRRDIVAQAAQHKLPASYAVKEYIATGGLMSYAPPRAEMFRLAGVYAGRILNGEKPADLPVQLPTKFELSINVATAKALGLIIPPSLLALADEVIE
jgi:ABC-type uncharacterized transport system substrate-binding protein